MSARAAGRRPGPGAGGRLLGWATASLALAGACLLAWTATAPEAGAHPEGSLRAQRAALGQVRRQLEAARARAAAAREREVSLLGELEQIDRRLETKRRELERLGVRLRGLEAELEVLEDRRGRLGGDLAAQRAAAAARLQAMGRLDARPASPGLLGETEAARRARLLSDLGRLVRADLGRLAAMDALAEQLGARQDAVARARAQLAALRGAAERERVAVAAEAGRRRALLARVRDDRAAYERVAAELEEASRRLEALVRELARRQASRRPAAAAPADLGEGPRGPAAGLGRLRGRLPWPAEGRIVAGFGRQVHPRFGTETFRRGVEIEAEEGAAIRAVYPGTVVYRGWLKGYGNLMILDHGEGYYTLYAHASELLVEEGDRVEAGEVIARVGETGAWGGPRLYFEVRYQGRPEDPARYLAPPG